VAVDPTLGSHSPGFRVSVRHRFLPLAGHVARKRQIGAQAWVTYSGGWAIAPCPARHIPLHRGMSSALIPPHRHGGLAGCRDKGGDGDGDTLADGQVTLGGARAEPGHEGHVGRVGLREGPAKGALARKQAGEAVGGGGGGREMARRGEGVDGKSEAESRRRREGTIGKAWCIVRISLISTEEIIGKTFFR